jgi:hypothetical protein
MVVHPVAMRTHTRCILSAAIGVLASQPLSAQEAVQPRTHTVVRGDNLWDLSQRYLGNPFLWPEIYRLNRDVVEDPHWIFPGEVIRLPGDVPVVAAVPGAEQPTPESIAGQPPAPVSPVSPTSETVFRKIQRAPVSQQVIETGGVIGVADARTVRTGEVIVAPYVDREGGPRGFGRILKSGDIAGIAEASNRFVFQAYDRIFISPPVGHIAPEGERYLAYRLGPILENQGQVVIPTGIIEVTKAARSDVAAAARVVRAFVELSADDRLIPIDTAGIGTTVRPRAVENGQVTTIRWVFGEPVLPSVQSFVVLGLSAQEGVKMGDEFLIYQPQTKAEDGAPGDPEIAISRVQVVRSTPYGVTAVVLGQEQPAIKEGMNARVIARMP